VEGVQAVPAQAMPKRREPCVGVRNVGMGGRCPRSAGPAWTRETEA
jgi:hypothetical protein